MRRRIIKAFPWLVIALLVITVIQIVGTWLYDWPRSGFGHYSGPIAEPENRQKTLWDLMDLLIVPLVLALGAWWLQKSERETEQKIEENRQHQATLDAFLDRLTDLMRETGLNDYENITKDEMKAHQQQRHIMRVRTLAALRSLDGERRRQVIEFLYDSAVIKVPGTFYAGGKYHGGVENAGMEGAHNRTEAPWYKEEDTFLDLAGAHLVGVELNRSKLTKIRLPEAELTGADLSGTRLEQANLIGANLAKARLKGAYMPAAGLSNANLNQADLGCANLSIAVLREADLRSADLTDAFLTGADLSKVKLSGARLKRIDLSGANLAQTNLAGIDLKNLTLFRTDFSQAMMLRADLGASLAVKAKFVGADLTDGLLVGASLKGADLSQANLTGADLRRADLSVYSGCLRWPQYESQATSLRGANLTGARLEGADLTGVDLTDAIVTPDQLAKVKSLVGATMPDGEQEPIYEPLTKRLSTIQPPPEYAVLTGILDQNVHALDGHPVAAHRYIGSHVYLMENGKMRWIKDIPTLEALRFQWRDVVGVGRESLERIPDGPTIPLGAGTPPKP